MAFGAYSGKAEINISQGNTSIGRRLLVVAEATEGVLYEPFRYDSKERAMAEFKGGPMGALIESGALPYGTELMRVNPYEMEEMLFAVKQIEPDWVYFDLLEVDNDVLDALSDFSEEVNASGKWTQLVLPAVLPKNEVQFKELMGYVEGLSIPTEDGVLELGRQISIVVEQFPQAALIFSVKGVQASPGEEITGMVIDRPLEKPISNDWLELYAKAGIVGFRIESGETVIGKAVNAVQTASPYRQLFITRAVQWFVNEWVARIDVMIGENMTQALYATQQETEQLINEYLSAEIFNDVSHKITYENLTGEITCELEILPVFGLDYIQASAVAKVTR